MTVASAIPAAVHPAIPASAHLIPGIKDWAAQLSSKIAHSGIDTLKRTDWSAAAFKVSAAFFLSCFASFDRCC